jgi:HD-GYP domain-containing protein (c-di-GMP phosphodiesterase class II)
MSLENARLHDALVDAYGRTVKALAAAIDAKDPYTCGHSQRVKEYALLAGRFLALPHEELEAVEYAGILHDVGKIGIVDTTLRKPSQLLPEEWVIMRGHPGIGASIIGDVPFLERAKELVLHHHERYDGSGYPNQLRREAIPLGARLIAVADAFDTMTTDRAYRSALSVDYALNELRKCSGTHFCPLAVEAFITAFRNRPTPSV